MEPGILEEINPEQYTKTMMGLSRNTSRSEKRLLNNDSLEVRIGLTYIERS